MLKILRKQRKITAVAADRSSTSESFDEYDVVVDDLSEAWEIINPPSSSDDDDENDMDDFSFTEEDEEEVVDATEDQVSSVPIKEEESPLDFGSPSSDVSMDSLSAQLNIHPFTEDADENDDFDDEYYDSDDGHDLDDELVPWGLSDKFGRQRIRKLGKRACPKMNKSKRLAYRYNRPGCVHGKHGFGVQHFYI